MTHIITEAIGNKSLSNQDRDNKNWSEDMDEARVWAKQGATEEQISEKFGGETAELALAAQGKKRID